MLIYVCMFFCLFMLTRSYKKPSPSSVEESKVTSSTDARPQKTSHDPSFGTKVSLSVFTAFLYTYCFTQVFLLIVLFHISPIGGAAYPSFGSSESGCQGQSDGRNGKGKERPLCQDPYRKYDL